MKKAIIILSIFALIAGGCKQGNRKNQSLVANSNNTNLTIMNKDAFWAIIENAKNTNTEKMYSNLTKQMTKLSKEDVFRFRAYLVSYMELANETIWIDMACKVINGYVSDDTGLYFTLWLIAQGETVLLNALKDPDTLAELPEIPFGNADFEMLMAVGFDEDEDIDEVEAGNVFEKIMEEITPSIQYKDGEKYGKYASFEEAMIEGIPNVLPKLIKRAALEQFDWINYI